MKKGKELPGRVGEKSGISKVPRPAGEVIWFHALSVGESLALLPLIEKALSELPEAHVVLTTSTATSVAALENAALPDRAHHVLLPIDTARATRAFLDHWSPSVAVFAELDFWPRLMIETDRRGLPMILINSRMSEKSFESRRKLGGLTKDVLRLFRNLLLQDVPSVDRFVQLGAARERIQVVGALKAAARPLPADPLILGEFRKAVGNRPMWLAAATERSEHPAIVEAARLIREAVPEALCIVAPRHIADGAPLGDAMEEVGLSVALRSGEEAVSAGTAVYIADTIGEMGLWYRLAPVSFVGHSLPPEGTHLGGKNPYEAAALNSVILHGPAVSDFDETYAALNEAGASLEVWSAEALAEAVTELLNEDARVPYLAAAARVVDERRAVLETTWQIIDAARAANT